MKTMRLFSMAAVALLMAACSNSDDFDVQKPAETAGVFHFEATIAAPNADASTRTVYTEEGATINVKWAVGDQIALVHNGVKDVAEVKAVDGSGNATIEATITGSPSDDDDVYLAYPANAVVSAEPDYPFPFTPNSDIFDKVKNDQDGTLAYIQDNLDLRMGSGKLAVSGSDVTLKGSVSIPSLICIWKLTLQDESSNALSATKLTFKNETFTQAEATSAAKSVYYLCVVPSFIPDASGTFSFEATVDSKIYTFSKTGLSLTAGKYYQSTVKMAEPAPTYYLKWNATQKELVATEIPTDATAVSNASGTVNWAAGTYVVDGNVTISGVISLQGAVNLIIKDGAKLTVGRIDGANYDFSIFGQSNMTGELVVKNSNRHAIHSLSTLEIHSCKVTALGVLNGRWGLDDIGTINVYGGSVDSKASENGGYGNGICLKNAGSMNIYGGLVKAEGKGSFNSNCYGVEGSATITVYGGKLWAGSPNKQAFGSNVTLTKGASFTGKIQTSNDNTTWTDWTTEGTPTTKYVKVE